MSEKRTKLTKRYFTENQQRQRKKLLGNNLKVARIGAGYTQAQVMEQVWGIDNNRNRISEIENGHVDISIDMLLILSDLYGCSTDYILGKSCEPINDIYASHINNVLINTRHYFEPMIEQMVTSITDVIKKVDKDEHLELVKCCEKISNYLIINNQKIKESDETLHHLLIHLEYIIRKINVKQAQKQTQIQAQLEQIAERMDREDKHRLLVDIDKQHQYSLPLPTPTVEAVA